MNQLNFNMLVETNYANTCSILVILRAFEFALIVIIL